MQTLRRVGLALMGFSLLAIIVDFAVSQPRILGFDFRLDYSILMAMSHLTILGGAFEMWRGRASRLAFLAALLACLPVCTPMYFLGVPLGTWAMILLSDPQIRAACGVKARTPSPRALWWLRWPAWTLIGLSLAALIVQSYWTISVALTERNPAGAIILNLIMLLPPATTLAGAIDMLRLRSYRNARAAALLASIPFCSPLFFLGIPFGLWSLALLRNPMVIEAFAARRSGASQETAVTDVTPAEPATAPE